MIKKVIKYIKEDYNRKTFIFTGISLFFNLSFAIYNGVIGLIYGSIWNISIFAYYLFLMCIKAVVILGEHYNKKLNKNIEYSIIYISYVLLIIITIAMIAPAILLVLNKREYNLGLIPAIVMATYTTYSITMSIVNINKVKTNENIIVKQIRLINMITALMSIIVLQNTMILANGEYTNDMKILSFCTSIAIILAVVTIIIISFVKMLKNKRKNNL